MATLNMTDQMTALEIVRRANMPDPWKIIDIMSQTNEMILDVPAYEANNGVKNIALQRVIRPMGEHRIYNKGVGKKATQTQKTEDRIAMLAEYSEVDAAMVAHSGNINQARMSEAVGIIKGMGLTQAQTVVYGRDLKAEEFSGLMERLNSLSNPSVVSMGGTGSNLTSLYLCAVGKDLFHLIYPKGSNSAGVKREDRGLVDVEDNDGKKYPAYRDYFEAQYGIAVVNPEAVIRICNIPEAAAGDDIVDAVLAAKRKLPKGASTYAMYSNMSVLIKIDKAARDKGNVVHTAADPWGREITHIREIRCRQMDVILDTEDQVA